MSTVPSGEEVFHGFPPDPNHRVDNVRAGRWAKYLQALIEAGGLADAQFFATKAAMDADLAHDEKSRAVVYGDGANNGVYLKSGASGSGSWSRILEHLPGYQFVSATDAGAGTANAISATASPEVSYNDGAQLIYVNISTTNTADAVTIAFDGQSPLDVKAAGGGDPGAGNLVAGSSVVGVVSGGGTEFLIILDGSAAARAEAAEGQAQAHASAALGHSDDAEAAQSAAEDAQAVSEGARDTAMAAAVSNGVYADTTEGLANTADGNTFMVPEDGGLRFHENDAGSAVAGDWVLHPLASQAEAEAGANNEKRMSPLRVKQAIDAIANVAQAALDDDGDSYIHAAADDVIRVRLGGTDVFDLVPAGIQTLLANFDLLDANGNTNLRLSKPASAVNYLNILSAATGDEVEIAAKGADTDINLIVDGKGTGVPKRSAGTGLLDGGVSGTLTAGYTEALDDDGTQSSGTYTPDQDTGNTKVIVNGGAFTLGVPSAASGEAVYVNILITNNASAGTITTSSFTEVDGDDFDTTDGNDFLASITVINKGGTTYSILNVQALQ